MKVYNTHNEIEDFKPCVKKPLVVYAIQINEPFRVISLEGDYAQGKSGDYLMKGVRGEHYICDKEIFEESYSFVEST